MRKMARSFFWIDQQIIRSGTWQRLTKEAKLSYVVLAASADREGVSQWGPQKLTELIGEVEFENFYKSLSELEEHSLIIRSDEGPRLGVAILSLSEGREHFMPKHQQVIASAVASPRAPIIIHTTTTVTVGEVHAERRNTV